MQTRTDPEDRRKTIADLAPVIRRDASQATGASATPLLERLLGALGPDQRAQVLAALETLHQALTADAHSAPAPRAGAGIRR